MALDAHGNPISDDTIAAEDAHHLHVIADEERQPLAAGVAREEQVRHLLLCHVMGSDAEYPA